MEQFLVIKNIVLIIGSIAIIYIGFNLIKTRIDTLSSVDIEKSLLKTIATSFLVTWANPQAIIDGTLLLGSYKLVLNGSEDLFFIIGVCIASFSWFTILSFLVNTMKKGFTPKIVNMINILSGSIIIIYGIKLGYEFIKTII
jgi:L-lysine exporter family protein LysE/ArgO